MQYKKRVLDIEEKNMSNILAGIIGVQFKTELKIFKVRPIQNI